MVSLKSNRRRERNFVWKVANDLRRRDGGAFFRGQFRESLRELRIAVVLAGVGGSEKLLGCGELGVQLRAVAPIRAPAFDESDT